jgi:hypothetical protein
MARKLAAKRKASAAGAKVAVHKSAAVGKSEWATGAAMAALMAAALRGMGRHG